jgi:hypothetical protein
VPLLADAPATSSRSALTVAFAGVRTVVETVVFNHVDRRTLMNALAERH